MRSNKPYSNREMFQIEKKLKPNDDKSPFSFGRWNYESIEKAIKKSLEEKNIPRFQLSKVEIHPAGSCNLHCSYCSGSKLAPKDKSNLSANLVESIFKDIRRNMPKENPLIILSGFYSEPLMNPEIKEIIQNIGKYNFRFGLYTNALLINDKIIDHLVKSAEESTDEKPCYISINVSASLNAENKKNDLFRIIKELVKKRKSMKNQEKLEINALILFTKQENYKSLHKLIDNLVKIGVDHCRLSIPWKQHVLESYNNTNNSENKYDEFISVMGVLKNDFKDKVRIRFLSKQGKFSNCYAMVMSLSISPEGDVYPCPETCSPYFKDKFLLGSISKNKISEIWRSQRHSQLFKSLNPDKANCRCCPKYNEFNNLCENIKNHIIEE